MDLLAQVRLATMDVHGLRSRLIRLDGQAMVLLNGGSVVAEEGVKRCCAEGLDGKFVIIDHRPDGAPVYAATVKLRIAESEIIEDEGWVLL